MADLKIRIFKTDESTPDTTITIPGNFIKIASNLVPIPIVKALENKGINLNELTRLSNHSEYCGILIKIEDHKKRKPFKYLWNNV